MDHHSISRNYSYIISSKGIDVKKNLLYAILTPIMVVIFGEIVPYALQGTVLPIMQIIGLIVFWAIVSAVFSAFIFKINPLWMILIFFCVGALAEAIIFKNVTGIAGVLFFGNIYITLFGIPYLIAKKTAK